MTTIYTQHDKTFANVSAYVILKDNERIATVAFKFGNAVMADVHILGSEMQRGIAKGGGYDRQTAAVNYAARKIFVSNYQGDKWEHAAALGMAMRRDGGHDWKHHVEKAGFTVWQAV